MEQIGFRINFLSLAALTKRKFCGMTMLFLRFLVNERSFWTYIVADEPYGTLYVGVTGDIVRRAHEHRKGIISGHAKKYGLKKLVWCAEFPTAVEAIEFEKKLKKWKRLWKIELIKKDNPKWDDLYEVIN